MSRQFNANLVYFVEPNKEGDISEDLVKLASEMATARQALLSYYGHYDFKCIVSLENLNRIGIRIESEKQSRLEGAIGFLIEHARIPEAIHTKRSIYEILEESFLRRHGKRFSRNLFYSFFTGGRVVVDI
ncbi:MAG TPA: hypothetical protein VJJ23_04020 [Candidatus Nanoarchaeia archaeon]|nr:hypothetical protein [Candidatus Nanoarchaeia archaeon]